MKYILTIFVLILLHSSLIYSQSYTDFTANDINGDEIRLNSFVEKGPVILGFWRSWCPSCKEEQRNMQIIYEKYKDKGFSYIGVNIDNQKSVSKVKSYASAMGFTFPVILDTDKKIFEMYGGSEDAVPYYLMIGKDKNIISTHLGYKSGDEKMIEEEISKALNLK
ncbi:MAG: TlpA disulfide reductase family protein [Ignavibacteria bacterium]|jgi:peroxiredoxin